MDPINQNPNQPVAPQQPIVPVPQPVAAIPVQPVSPVVTNPVAPVDLAPKPKFQFPSPKVFVDKVKGLPRKYKFLIGWVLFMVVLVIIAMFTAPGRRVTQLILPSPSPIPTVVPVGEVFVPSPYATDSEVLQLEKNVQEYDAKLGATQLRDDTLRMPAVDWNVNFKN